jgi:hypothetical protein
MSAPSQSAPVAVSVTPNRDADRVIYTFGDQSFALTVEDAMLLGNHTLAAIDVLRPLGFTANASKLPAPDTVQ